MPEGVERSLGCQQWKEERGSRSTDLLRRARKWLISRFLRAASLGWSAPLAGFLVPPAMMKFGWVVCCKVRKLW